MAERVLITGASSGIGLELAKVFASKGHPLIISARSIDKLAELALLLQKEYGATVDVIKADLSTDRGAVELYNNVKGNVDILVNNAGIGQFGDFLQSDEVHESAMVSLNISSLLALTRLFGKAMAKRGRGKIMNVASVAGFMPMPGMAVYAATKAFVRSLSEALSAELADQGITVTALCPGPVSTGFEKTAGMENSKLFQLMRPATPDTVAGYGYRACMAGKRVAVPGFLNKISVFSSIITPRTLFLKTLRRMVR